MGIYVAFLGGDLGGSATCSFSPISTYNHTHTAMLKAIIQMARGKCPFSFPRFFLNDIPSFRAAILVAFGGPSGFKLFLL